LLLGAVLLVSGVAKVISPHDAASLAIQALPLSADSAVVFIYVLSAAASLCGLLLLFGRLIAPIALAVGLFLVSAIVYGAASLSHPQPCGCFGTLIDSTTDEVFLARNMLLLLLTLFILKKSAAIDEKVAP
jgi:uncharacterized membrane protein YphA (DoxX/SURF4 family)